MTAGWDDRARDRRARRDGDRTRDARPRGRHAADFREFDPARDRVHETHAWTLDPVPQEHAAPLPPTAADLTLEPVRETPPSPYAVAEAERSHERMVAHSADGRPPRRVREHVATWGTWIAVVGVLGGLVAWFSTL